MYPDSHDEQQHLVQEFKEVLLTNFAICAGAIEGLLIWIHKLTQNDCN